MHYICTGECMGVSDKPGACQTGKCSKHSKPLERCACHDGRHNNWQKKDKDKKS